MMNHAFFRLNLVLGGLVAVSGLLVAQQPADPPAKTEPAPQPMQVVPKAGDAKEDPFEKRVTVTFDGKSWNDVIAWLSNQTGLPFIGGTKPTGSFNFHPPVRPGQPAPTYTIPEIIDIINEALMDQHHLLIRREASFTIVTLNDEGKPNMPNLPNSSLEDLRKRGKTEVVKVILPLKSLVAQDLASEIKKSGQLTSFGDATYWSATNQLILTDTVGNLRNIIDQIQKQDDPEKGANENLEYQCKYIKARDAEQRLKDLLGDGGHGSSPAATMMQGNPWMGGGFPGAMPGMDGFGGRPSPFGQPADGMGFPGSTRGNRGGAFALTTPSRTTRPHYVASNEETNRVYVTGPANIIAQARDLLKKMDIQHDKNQKPNDGGSATMETYAVPPGNADPIAQALNKKYQNVNSVRIGTIGNNTILVQAYPEDQFEIGSFINQAIKGTKATSTELIPLRTQDATDVAKSLVNKFGDRAKDAGAPFIEADTGLNAVRISGTAEQLKEIKEFLYRGFGEGPGGGGPGVPSALGSSANMRVIQLPNGSAVSLAEEIARLMKQMRPGTNVQILNPGGASPVEEAPQPKKETPKEKKDKPDAMRSLNGDLWHTSGAPPQQGQGLVDPQEKKETPKEQPKEKTITLMASGNRLIVQSDDPEALVLIAELVRLITRSDPTVGDFQVLPVKNALAADAAKVIDEAFNGPRQTGPQMGGNPFMRGGMQFNMPMMRAPESGAGAETTTKVRVVADPTTNSLLVRASPIDMLTVKRLLAAIDRPSADAGGIRPHVVKLRYANASDVSWTIQNVFREYTNNDPRFGIGAAFSAGTTRNIGSDGQQRAVTLSVSAETQSNSVVLMCTDKLLKDVQEIIKLLDVPDAAQVVVPVPVKNVDPRLIQEAIDAIMGRQTSNTSSGMGGFGNFGGGRGFGGGFGGGFPGGGGGFGGRGFGGGGFPGGGGGFGGRGFGGGMGRPPGRKAVQADWPGGSYFFVDRVTDDPKFSLLFDPQQVELASYQEQEEDESIQLVFGQQPAPPVEPAQSIGPNGEIRGPLSNVRAEALSELGVIVISGNDADVRRMLELIRYLQEQGAGSEIQLLTVPLEHADATSVSNTLTQVFQRVNFAQPGATTQIRPTQTTGTQQINPFIPAFLQQPAGGQSPQASILLVPLVRFNAIMVASPKARVADVVAEIKKLDLPISPSADWVPFPLTKASAQQVATMIQQLYASIRFPGDQNQVRCSYDISSNTVFVQAAPAELESIRKQIKWIESNESKKVNDLQVIRLRNQLSDNLSQTLLLALTQGVIPPTSGTGIVPISTTGTGAPGGVPGFPAAPAAPAAPALPGLPGLPGTPARPGTTTGTSQGITTATTSLRFFGNQPNQPTIESGYLEDVHITSDPPSNSLIVSAPPKTMELIKALIHELDVPGAAQARINVFHLVKADATDVSNWLRQLFTGTTTTGGGGPGGFPGPGGTPGGTSTATTRLLPTLTGDISPGATLIELHVATDIRTNSLIVAGSQNDLDVIQTLISRIDDQSVPERTTMVFKLRNAAAADIANTLQTYYNSALGAYTTELTAFQQIQREVIVVPDAVSNSLLVSATPTYFSELQQVVDRLDAQPPQVVIEVLIGEVDLTNNDEFGIQLGGQSPVLFDRSVFAGGVTVNNAVANPGFGFNTTTPLPTNTAAAPNLVGFQGISNLGVGTASQQLNVGGLVLQASSNSVSVLVRALKNQGRIDILSRPTVMTYDNQSASLNLGQLIPYLSNTSVTSTGVITSNIAQKQIGVILNVTPRIAPDGRVIMRVTPEVSSLITTPFNLGNGQIGTGFNVQSVDTTVAAADGETVLIGGLITKNDARNENKLPWLGDLPGIGGLFRFRTRYVKKTELVIIMTPHIIYCQADVDRIMAQETSRMDWIMSDVARTHGHGIEKIAPPGTNLIAPSPSSEGMVGPNMPVVPGAAMPPGMLPPATPNGTLHPPAPLPPPAQSAPPAPVAPNQTAPPSGPQAGQPGQLNLNTGSATPAGIPNPFLKAAPGNVQPAVYNAVQGDQSNQSVQQDPNSSGKETQSWSAVRPR